MSLTSVTSTPIMPGTQSSGGGQTLGKDDFLKVLVAQMQHMDPMNAEGGDQEFIAQMTRFSMLEQLQNMARANERSSTFALIGKTVTWQALDGTVSEGLVESVQAKDGTLTLTVGGQPGVDPQAVVSVR